MQEPAQETLLVGADRPFEQDQDIAIRMQRELPAPVATERQDRARRVGWRRREEEALQQRVDTIGVPLRGRAAGRPLYRVLDQLLARRVERGRSARARRAIGRFHGSSFAELVWRLHRIMRHSRSLAMPSLVGAYLVFFMQAGFALLTCGLVRKKNAAHLVMLSLSAYVFAFMAYYAVGYAFQFGGIAVNADPSNLASTPTLNQFLIGRGHWGLVGGTGFFLSGAAHDASSSALA